RSLRSPTGRSTADEIRCSRSHNRRIRSTATPPSVVSPYSYAPSTRRAGWLSHRPQNWSHIPVAADRFSGRSMPWPVQGQGEGGGRRLPKTGVSAKGPARVRCLLIPAYSSPGYLGIVLLLTEKKIIQ